MARSCIGTKADEMSAGYRFVPGSRATELDMRDVNTHADNWVPAAVPPPGKTKKTKKSKKSKKIKIETAATVEL